MTGVDVAGGAFGEEFLGSRGCYVYFGKFWFVI